MSSYAARTLSPEQAAALVKSGDWVDYSFCLGHPYAIDKALAARRDELTGVNIRGGIVLRPLEVMECDPTLEHFAFHSWHMGGYERRMSDLGRCCYIPLSYQYMPRYYEKLLDVDVAFLSVTPPDHDGWFNFSLTNSASLAIIRKARKVVLEINRRLPVIGGHENGVHIGDVDFIVESGDPELPVLPMAAPSEADQRIAEAVITQMHDGDVIQLGIGGLPNAIGQLLAESDLKDLGAHSELLVDAFRVLADSGRLTNRLKHVNYGQTVFTFGVGSAELYAWARNNSSLLALPVDRVNDPHVIGRHDAMISINSCLEVDLFGQISAESTGSRQISGSGGQMNFALGAFESPHGKSFICCQSTYLNKKTGKLASRIVPTLTPGTIVTTPRFASHCLVTEWGIAVLAGQSIWEKTERIISVAHPDFRDDLIRQAEALRIWRRSNRTR